MLFQTSPSHIGHQITVPPEKPMPPLQPEAFTTPIYDPTNFVIVMMAFLAFTNRR